MTFLSSIFWFAKLLMILTSVYFSNVLDSNHMILYECGLVGPQFFSFLFNPYPVLPPPPQKKTFFYMFHILVYFVCII